MSEENAKPSEIEDNPPPPLQGDDLLEQIAQRRYETPEADQPPEDAPATDHNTDDETGTEAHAKRLAAEELAKTFVKAKVYGEEREVPIADLLKHYQIDQAAEQKLQQAKLLEQHYHQKLAELENPPAPPVQHGADKRAAMSNVFDAWSNGEEFNEADLAVLFGRNAEPAEIARQVREQMIIEDALGKYKADYADLAADPYLDDITAKRLEASMRQGKPFDQSLIEAAEATREWVKQFNAGTEAKPTSEAAQKRATAQANLRNTPTSTASARQPIGTPKTPSIEEIRRQAIREMMDSNRM